MRNILASFIVITLLSSQAFAADKSFTVNPETIRDQLFSKNMSLLLALNNVQNSKLNVGLARAKLLPSLNLSILLPAMSNPTFLLSSVTILFPFLVPSNWAVLKQSKELFESDKASYKAIQLNVLTNALSLYHTFLTDQKVQSAYTEQAGLLGRLYTSLKNQSDILGNVASEDLQMAQAQWQDSKIRVSKLQELLIEEKANLRVMLGLTLGTELVVEDSALPASDYEDKAVGEIADHSLLVAPEAAQLGYLLQAAKTAKFAKLFGFISSASIGGVSSSGDSPFNQLKAGGGFVFGADTLENIKIANNNERAIFLRLEQLRDGNEKTAEIISGKLVEVKNQQDLSSKALESRMLVFVGQQRQYTLGLIPLQTLLLTQAQLTDSKVNVLKTNLDLKMQRLTLERLVIDGDFAQVKGCVAAATNEKKSIFHRAKDQSLDQICQH